MKRGYRAWKQEISPEPRLLSPSYSSYVWTPGENVSDWPAGEYISSERQKGYSSGQEEEAFKKSSHGFYSRKRLEDLIKEGYYEPGSSERIAGTIIPYGKVLEAESGFRSEKAEIAELFEDPSVLCEICRRNPVDVLLEVEDTTAHVCNDCYKKIARALPTGRKEKIKDRSWWEIKKALASHYQVPLIELPEEFRKLK